MSELVDKVARGICLSDNDYEWDDPMCDRERYLHRAKAAIAAVREHLGDRHHDGSGDHWDAIDELSEALK